MGYKNAFDGLVPARFLCMTGHLVTLMSIFIGRVRFNDMVPSRVTVIF
jgi:hypothetical protein